MSQIIIEKEAEIISLMDQNDKFSEKQVKSNKLIKLL